MWRYSQGGILCVGVAQFDLAPAWAVGHVAPFETVPNKRAGKVDLARIRMCVEQLPLQEDQRFAMRPWLFEGDPTSESIALLIRSADIIHLDNVKHHKQFRQKVFHLCSVFAREGTVILTDVVCDRSVSLSDL